MALTSDSSEGSFYLFRIIMSKRGYDYKRDVIRKDARNRHTHNAGWIKGDHWVVCDVCGCDIRHSDIRMRWDNVACCPDDWEPRHEQDFVRGKADKTAPSGIVRSPPDPLSAGRIFLDQAPTTPPPTFGGDIIGSVDPADGVIDVDPALDADFRIFAEGGAQGTTTSGQNTITVIPGTITYQSAPNTNTTLKGFSASSGLGSINPSPGETLVDTALSVMVRQTTNTIFFFQSHSVIFDPGPDFDEGWDVLNIGGVSLDRLDSEPYNTIEPTASPTSVYWSSANADLSNIISQYWYNNVMNSATPIVLDDREVDGSGFGYEYWNGLGELSAGAVDIGDYFEGATSVALLDLTYSPETNRLTLIVVGDEAGTAEVNFDKRSFFSLQLRARDSDHIVYTSNASYITYPYPYDNGRNKKIAQWDWTVTDKIMYENDFVSVNFAQAEEFTYTFPITLGGQTNLPKQLPVALK